MVNRWQNFAARLVLLFAASYGLLYFSYKFGIPWSGTGDYSRYYNMYMSPFNLHATQSPFVLRQVSGVLTYLVWKAHIYYPNQIWFQAAGFDQRIFFAALFTNWVFLVLAAATAGVIAEEIAGRRNAMIAVVAGFLCLLSFHTQYVVITGVTEGPSWFLLTVGFLAYLRKMRVALALILMLAIFQRETLLIVFGCIAAFDLIRQRVDVGFRLTIFGWSLACFGFYLGLRRLLPGYEDETHLGGMLSVLRSTHFNGDLLFQGLLSQNIILISVILALAVKATTTTKGRWLPVLLATLLCLDLAGLASGIGNNIGRVGGLLTPIFAALAAVDLKRLDRSDEDLGRPE
jgi:hypothetical protein